MTGGYRTLGLIGAAVAAMVGATGTQVTFTDTSSATKRLEPRTPRPAVPRSGRPMGWNGRIRGPREAERARRQWAQIRARREVRALAAAGAIITTEQLLEANLKPPRGYHRSDAMSDLWVRAPLVYDVATGRWSGPETSALDWRGVYGTDGEKFDIQPGDFRNAIPIVPV